MREITFDPYCNRGEDSFAFIWTLGQGIEQMSDMSRVYRNTSTVDLRYNRARKMIQLQKIDGREGWWNKRDSDRLRELIHQIDVELAARESQLRLIP